MNRIPEIREKEMSIPESFNLFEQGRMKGKCFFERVSSFVCQVISYMRCPGFCISPAVRSKFHCFFCHIVFRETALFCQLLHPVPFRSRVSKSIAAYSSAGSLRRVCSTRLRSRQTPASPACQGDEGCLCCSRTTPDQQPGPVPLQ